MINLVVPINNTSYGYVSCEVLFHLSKITEVTLHKINEGPVMPKYHKCIQDGISNLTRWDAKKPSIRIFHEFDLALHAGSPRIAFPFFEMNKLDEIRINHLKNQDLVVVASHWAKDVLSNYNIDSEVVPLGINEELEVAPVEENPANKCIFATVGKWETRKGHDVLHKIFNSAFPKETDVELWCFCSNPFLKQEEIFRLENNYRIELGNRVKFFPRVDNLSKYLKFVHAGIFLSRAEGWNLGLLEMMAMGKHVVATNYSGHTEFCNKENAFLVDIDELESAYDGKWFFGNGDWAKLGPKQIEQTISHLRHLYGMFYENKKINSAGLKVKENFTFRKTAEKLYAISQRV